MVVVAGQPPPSGHRAQLPQGPTALFLYPGFGRRRCANFPVPGAPSGPTCCLTHGEVAFILCASSLCPHPGKLWGQLPSPSSPNQIHCGRATFRLPFFLFAKHVLLPAYKNKGFKHWENKLVLVIVAEVIKLYVCVCVLILTRERIFPPLIFREWKGRRETKRERNIDVFLSGVSCLPNPP